MLATLYAPAAAALTLRVNAGGAAYTDSNSNTWNADTGYSGGYTWNWGSQTINGTSDPTPFRSERFAQNMQYAFTVPNDTYLVKLYFAESFASFAGYRVFSVQVNGATIVSNLDVFAAVGAHTALVRTATVNVTTGQLVLNFTASSDNALINAIELIGQSSAPDTTAPTVPTGLGATGLSTTQVQLSWTGSTDAGTGVGGYHVFRNGTQVGTTAAGVTSYTDGGLTAGSQYTYTVTAFDLASPANESAPSTGQVGTTQSVNPTTAIRINAGGAGFVDSLGNSWSADAQFNTGTVSDWGSVAIANTADPTIYRTERFDVATAPELQYDLAVPNGTYTVRLHFAENYITTAWPNGGVGARVFSVQAEGATVLPNLDIVAEAGSRAALVKTFSVTVSDGVLNLRFVHGVENPLVNGIEVLSTGQSDTTPPTVPTGLGALALSSSSIQLSWNSSTDSGAGLAGYRV